VVVFDERCELYLRERQRKVNPAAGQDDATDKGFSTGSRYQLAYSGELEFRTERPGGTATIRDKRHHPLETQLNQVIIALLQTASAKKTDRLEQENRRLAQIERDRRLAIERERVRQETNRVKNLNSWMQAADRHRRLVTFIADLRGAIGEVEPSSELGKWLDWATRYAESANVLRRFRDRQSSIRLYHCLPTYTADRVVSNGFEAQRPSYGEDQEMPAAVTLTDVPMQGVYGGTVCVVVDVPEALALVYEEPKHDLGYREFKFPSDVINAFPRRLDPGGN
jgi:hypothetical protein